MQRPLAVVRPLVLARDLPGGPIELLDLLDDLPAALLLGKSINIIELGVGVVKNRSVLQGRGGALCSTYRT